MNSFILKNARIYPNEELNNIFIENSFIKKIIPVGIIPANNNSNMYNTYTCDIKGKYIIPAFTDAHSHYISWALSKTGPYLGYIKSKNESLSIVSDYILNNNNNKIILACDYDESQWTDNQELNKKDVDKLSNKIPIIFRRICGHYAVCNSKALELMSIIIKKNNININLINFETGVMLEDPVLKIYELIDFSSKDYENAIKYIEDECLKMGITSVGEISTKRGRKELIKYYKKNNLKIRFKCSVLDNDIDEFLNNENDRINENFLSFIAIKTFIDGSIGGRTAYVDFNWNDLKYNKNNSGMAFSGMTSSGMTSSGMNSSGIRLKNNIEIFNLIKKAKDNNLMIWIHAIGNKAIDLAITEIEKFNYPDMIRIEHFELPDLSIINRVKKLKIFLSMQPNFIRLWSGSGDQSTQKKLYEKVIPENFLYINNPLSLLEDQKHSKYNNNTTIAFGSDTMPPGPFWGISGAVNAEYDSQKISLESAIKYYTENSAKAVGENNIGKIENNKKADILVLSEKPTNSNLDTIKIEKVFVEGKEYNF